MRKKKRWRERREKEGRWKGEEEERQRGGREKESRLTSRLVLKVAVTRINFQTVDVPRKLISLIKNPSFASFFNHRLKPDFFHLFRSLSSRNRVNQQILCKDSSHKKSALKYI